MDFKSYIAATSVGSDRGVPFHGLTLVNSRKPKAATGKLAGGPGIFGRPDAAQFCDLGFGKIRDLPAPLHLYYCVRCKWAFQVDDRNGLVTPLDPNGKPLQQSEAADRLATFGVGPCPVFTRLNESARVTQVVTRRESLRARFTALLHATGRIWKEADHEAGNDLPRSARA